MSKKDEVEETTISDKEDAVEEAVAEPEAEAEATAEPEGEQESEAEAEPLPEPEPEPAPEPEPEPEWPREPVAEPATARESGSGGVAWLAFFLSLITLSGVSYLVYEDWVGQRDLEQRAGSIADLRNRIASSSESLSNLDKGLAELAAADERAASELELLQRDLDNRIQMLDSLPGRVATLESSMANLQGVSAGARDTWLLAEAEYYMQIANAQLQLAGNPHLAALALGMADERLVQLANPALTEVRAALADELAALEGMEKPDIEGVTLTLASLARVVDSLPLRAMGEQADDEDADVDPEMSGFDRAWASVKGAVSGLVRITGPEDTAAPLLTPDAVYFLRTNLTLQLQAARLALLRGEQAVFEQSLDDAQAWLELFFDTRNTQVRSAIQTIGEMRGSLFATAVPDISGSLRLLRQFKVMSEPTQ